MSRLCARFWARKRWSHAPGDTSWRSPETSWIRSASAGWRARVARRLRPAIRPRRPDCLPRRWKLWRGRALADFAYEQFAQSEAARLEETRLGALEDRIDAQLALGRHRELTAELEDLWRRHPHRERLLGQLMLALYLDGRQADALDAYRRGRKALSDELGLEPGPRLRLLERQILEQDPVLDREDGAASPAPRGRPSTIAQPRRMDLGRWLLVGAGALLLAAAVGAGVTQLAGGSAASLRAGPNSLAEIDPGSNQVVATAQVGASPGAVAFGDRSLWVANVDDETISRLSPRTLQTQAMVRLSQQPTGVAASRNGAVWVVMSNPTEDYVTAGRVDPQFDSLDDSIRVGNVDPAVSPSITSQGKAVWIAPPSGELTRLNAENGARRQRIDPDASPAAVVFGYGAIWLTDSEADDVIRIDRTGLRLTVPVGDDPSGIAAGNGAVWVADSGDDAIKRIDPTTEAVTTTIHVGSDPLGVIVGGGSIWVANSRDGTVSRIDPRTNRVVATIPVGGSPQALAFARGRVWVTIDAAAFPRSKAAGRGGTLRVDFRYDPTTMDPAIADIPFAAQLFAAGCAELLNYPVRSGLAGSRLVPEVARALPTVSADGRTYTFVIRRGFRFAPPSNLPVTAQTFKDTIERTLDPVMDSPALPSSKDIVGASAYIRGKAGHISGVLASGDRLTIHLLAPDPNLPYQLAQSFFCAVPPDTPVNPNGVSAIPSAGPYSVVSYTPGRGIVMLRNPNYRGDRPHRFDRIDVSLDVASQHAIAAVEAGRADFADSVDISAGATKALGARYGAHSPAARSGHQQFFVRTEPGLDFFVLNTHRALFSHERLREAVNYAIDRSALARFGDPLAASPEAPFDHYLPPGVPGYRNVNVFPAQPDLAKARRLARGFAGATVVLYTCEATFCVQQAQIVKTDLAAIGLRVVVDKFTLFAMFSREQHPGGPFDMGYSNWIEDFPDPADFLNGLLNGSSGLPSFRDASVRAEPPPLPGLPGRGAT